MGLQRYASKKGSRSICLQLENTWLKKQTAVFYTFLEGVSRDKKAKIKLFTFLCDKKKSKLKHLSHSHII